MEREGVEDTARVLRAIRSLVYNRRVLPIIERRIFQAETTIRAHLLVRNSMGDHVGPYQVELDVDENIRVTQTSFDEWSQMSLPIDEVDFVLTERSHQTLLVERSN